MTNKRFIIAICLLAAEAVMAQIKPTNITDSTLTIQPPPRQPMVMIGGGNIIEIKDKDGKLMVLVSADGKITYGDDYPPAASARVFWEKLAEAYPVVCKAKEKP